MAIAARKSGERRNNSDVRYNCADQPHVTQGCRALRVRSTRLYRVRECGHRGYGCVQCLPHTVFAYSQQRTETCVLASHTHTRTR